MGKSDNMMMLEHVRDVIETLQIDDDEQLKLVAVDQNGQIQVADGVDELFWPAAIEAYVFFFKSPDECIVRHIDENYVVHKQVLLHNGFVICVDCVDSENPCQLSLYRGKKLIASSQLTPLAVESFHEVFDSLWNEYIAEVQFETSRHTIDD